MKDAVKVNAQVFYVASCYFWKLYKQAKGKLCVRFRQKIGHILLGQFKDDAFLSDI